MTTIKHEDFKLVLRTHELAFAADAGFHMPEHDFEILIEALRIAVRETKPKSKPKMPHVGSQGFE